MRRRFAAVLSWETVIMGFIWPRKYGICLTSKFIADWADHKQLGETQQDETFLIQFTGDISCLTLKKKKKKKWGRGGGSIFPGIILVRHGFYTRRSERRLLSGVCTVKRATKDHKSEQFVSFSSTYVRWWSTSSSDANQQKCVRDQPENRGRGTWRQGKNERGSGAWRM